MEVQMNYEMYADARGEWRWSLQSGNGRKIANSGEGYKNKQDCLAAIELVKSSMFAEVRELAPQARIGLMKSSGSAQAQESASRARFGLMPISRGLLD
jgi:uncharacterized protein YegP (UPF0339 family)